MFCSTASWPSYTYRRDAGTSASSDGRSWLKIGAGATRKAGSFLLQHFGAETSTSAFAEFRRRLTTLKLVYARYADQQASSFLSCCKRQTLIKKTACHQSQRLDNDNDRPSPSGGASTTLYGRFLPNKALQAGRCFKFPSYWMKLTCLLQSHALFLARLTIHAKLVSSVPTPSVSVALHADSAFCKAFRHCPRLSYISCIKKAVFEGKAYMKRE